MSTLKAPKTISRRQELRQDTVVTFSARLLALLQDNRQIGYALLAAVILVVASILAFRYYHAAQDEEATRLLVPVVRAYEDGNYKEALDGIAGAPGLIEIADKFGGTVSGNLARFYAGDAFFRIAEFDEALDYFQRYEVDASYIGASALAGQGAVFEISGDHRRAGDLYRRASYVMQSEITSPEYLAKAGVAYEAAAQYESALAAFREIKEKYPNSTQARSADIMIARVEAKL